MRDEGVVDLTAAPSDLERKELSQLFTASKSEKLPTSLAGFKAHNFYCLSSQLLRDEVLRPGAKRLHMFNGKFVYLRLDVEKAKTEKAWLYGGRKVRDGEKPVKVVKKRQMPKKSDGFAVANTQHLEQKKKASLKTNRPGG